MFDTYNLKKQIRHSIHQKYHLVAHQLKVAYDLLYRVKSGKFGHQVKSDTRLQTVEIQMRRLLMSRLIRIFTVCLVNLFLFQYLKYETSKVAVRI